MSNHLSAAQIAEWAAGEWREEQETHLRECPDCQWQVEEFQAVLGQFRGAVRQWSAARQQPGSTAAWKTKRTSLQATGLYWAAAMAAALCALVAVLVFHGSAANPVFPQETHSPVTDAALMRQVDTEVSQTVPDAMEPLMKLVSWDDSAAVNTPNSGASAKKEE